MYVGLIQDSGNGVLKQIAADPNYGIGAILLTHDDEASIPTQQQFEANRNFLLKQGMTQSQINEAIGTAVNGRTRWRICQDLIDWLKAH